jgi:hypothetical protein
VRYLGSIALGVALLALLAVIIVGQPMRYDGPVAADPTPSCAVAPRCTLTLLTTPELTPTPVPTLGPTFPPPHYATQAPVCTTRKLSDTTSIKFCD